MEAMIEAQGIGMDYGRFRAVHEVSFRVGRGEVVGLLGPNGAGKTTIMKILATQLAPTRGTARVAGHDVRSAPREVRSALGYLPEEVPLYEEMEVREYLDFVAAARRIHGLHRRTRLEWVRRQCRLEAVWCQPVGRLSKGYRQRVGLAQALVHDPPVLILDEPTSGLDPLQIIEVRDLVRRLARDKAVLFSTHILQEVAAVADRVLVLSDGELVADDPLPVLARAGGALRVAVAAEGDVA
ncbi:ATP-binding cassette domain-containing protein, partial [Dissulfurirhabdus thermomarina]